MQEGRSANWAAVGPTIQSVSIGGGTTTTAGPPPATGSPAHRPAVIGDRADEPIVDGLGCGYQVEIRQARGRAARRLDGHRIGTGPEATHSCSEESTDLRVPWSNPRRIQDRS